MFINKEEWVEVKKYVNSELIQYTFRSAFYDTMQENINKPEIPWEEYVKDPSIMYYGRNTFDLFTNNEKTGLGNQNMLLEFLENDVYPEWEIINYSKLLNL